jgi:tRNA pseudouridine synthase 10
MERRVNAAAPDKVQVAGLRPSTKSEVVRLKGSTYEKTYRITFTVHGGIDLPKLEDASRQLTGAMIKQRTPSRVAHRRADLERLRRVARFHIQEAFGDRATVEVRGESGIYVKELIHGDRGRTQPSLSGLLGTSCDVVELDVLEVHDSTPKGG